MIASLNTFLLGQFQLYSGLLGNIFANTTSDPWAAVDSIGTLSVGGLLYVLYQGATKERQAITDKMFTVFENAVPIFARVASTLEKVEAGFKDTAQKAEDAPKQPDWLIELNKTLKDVQGVLERNR